MKGVRNTPEVIVSLLVKRDNGCWEWTGCIRKDGYGSVGMDRKACLVHRVSYEHFKGPVPDGPVIDHLCRNKACANPDHLEAVPQGVNLHRGDALPAKNSQKPNCPKCGSEYARRSNRKRFCRPCSIQYKRNRRA